MSTWRAYLAQVGRVPAVEIEIYEIRLSVEWSQACRFERFPPCEDLEECLAPRVDL